MKTNPIIHLAMADDHTLFRSGLINIITSFDHCRVDIDVDNGKLLVERIEQASRIPDVCIIDVNMPEMNGYETLRAIKDRWPAVKVLVLSAHSNEFCIIKMLREGADGYLSKNCTPRELQNALLSLQKYGFYYPEFISGRLINLLQNKSKNLPVLTDKELQFLSLCATELTYKEIANILCVSPRTIDKFSKVLFEKLNVNTRTSLATFAFHIGLSTDPNAGTRYV